MSGRIERFAPVDATPVIGIHLDLKYAIPSKAYLNRWAADLPKLGMNTLLIEYEDKFPFRKHPFLRHEDAFTEDELKRFLDAARGAGLRVVPLVQSLSHLEFALGHEKLAHLRERSDIITQIDTSNPDALRLVFDLMDDVLAMHEEDEWFHVGGDEAWSLGFNERSKRQLDAMGKLGLWAHVEKQVLDHVIAAGKRPIIWDDALWGEPRRIAETDLPKRTILMSWGYARKFEEGPGGYLKRLEVYRAAGYDAIGAPCLNWGVLTPRHDHCLGNTACWADAARRAPKGEVWGLINTAWISFHVLPHSENFYIAATAEAMRDPARIVDRAWQAAALSDHFGADAAGVPEALQALGEIWEAPIDGYGRPITPILYGIMDMVVWFGSQERRMAVGSYPLDMSSVDFTRLYRRKLVLLRGINGGGAITAKLRELVAAFTDAGEALGRLARAATKRAEEAAWFAFAARMKLAHARILLHELQGEGDRAALGAAWSAIGEELSEVMKPFVDAGALRLLRRIWWQPIADVLNEPAKAF